MSQSEHSVEFQGGRLVLRCRDGTETKIGALDLYRKPREFYPGEFIFTDCPTCGETISGYAPVPD
jgi:hypothetical protein